MNSMEIEFKYDASAISILKFKAFCKEKKPKAQIEIFATDTFYSRPGKSESFYRHRINSDSNELTFKRKINKDNSFVRVEHNIPLQQPSDSDKIRNFTSELGYTVESKIHKFNLIFQFEYFVMSYYICYDQEMKELGRFMEIEAREDIKWFTEDNAISELVVFERLCKPLGISSKDRLKMSLFEMFGARQ